MQTLRWTLLVLSFGSALTACGDGQFAGQSGKAADQQAAAPQRSAKSGDATPGNAGAANGTGQTTGNKGQAATTASASASAATTAAQPAASNLVAATSVLSGFGQNADAVGTCLGNLGITQLPPDAAQNFQEIGASSMSPFANTSVTDPDLTTKPGEVYIRLVHMQGFGPVVNFDMNLLNPAGIYCITTDSFSVFTSSKITMCKTGKIASTVANHTNLFDNANVLKVGCD